MTVTQRRGLKLLWLELTHKCNLECVHCYTSSSPRSPHGRVPAATWHDLLAQAAELEVETVCFIGGEPTLNPELPALLDHASRLGLQAEVFTNLTRISEELWDCFVRNAVGLATSIYAVDPAEHDRVTTRRGSHHRTMRNVARARELGLTVRAGVVEVSMSQEVDRLSASLAEAGIEATVDRHRKLGRDQPLAQDFSQLCGNCAAGSAVVDPDGEVFPCIMSRWLGCGNVHESSLGAIVGGRLAQRQGTLEHEFAVLGAGGGEPGQGCGPTPCPPMYSECPPHFSGPCAPNCSPYRG